MGDETRDEGSGDTLQDHAPELPVRAPRGPRPRAALGLAALGLVALGASALAGRGPAEQARGFFANATLPRSASAEALQAYRTGLDAMRGSAWEAGVEHFERATRLDPSLAVAHLRLAMALGWPGPEARAALRRAAVLRSSLSERDQVFLEALEPVYFQEPPDRVAQVRRLREGVRRFPEDAEMAMHLAISLQAPPTWEEAQRWAERALALEPGYPDALQTRARALAARGEIEPALEELGRCAQQAPLAVGCLRARAQLLASRGRCEEMTPTLRQWAAVEPRSFEPQLLHAGVLARQEKPWPSIEELLQQRWTRSSEAERPVRERKDRIRLALHRGEWARAQEGLAELLQQGRAADDPETDEWATEHLLFVLEARGASGERARGALAYLDRTEGRPVQGDPLDQTRLRAAVAAFHGGLLSPEETLRRGAPGVASATVHPLPLALARTPGEARAALQGLPKTDAEPPAHLALLIARAQELAGDLPAARQTLAPLLQGCDGLALPHLMARFALGKSPR